MAPKIPVPAKHRKLVDEILVAILIGVLFSIVSFFVNRRLHPPLHRAVRKTTKPV